MRGRKAIEVNRDELQNVVNQIESADNPPKNRTQLWERVSATDWAMAIKLSPQVAMNKANLYEIDIKTPKGARGRIKGAGPVKNAGKRKIRSYTPAGEKEIRTEFESLGSKTVKSILSGKIRAAVKAFCYQCMGESKKEVRLCTAYGCPLWIHRPYQNNERKAHELPVVESTHQMDDSEGHESGSSD